MMMHLRADLMDIFFAGNVSAVVDLNDGMAKKILQDGTFSKERKGRWKEKKIYLIPHKTYKEHTFFTHGESTPIPELPENAILLE